MQFDWASLGVKAPTALVKARTLAHHAVQWAVKSARANLAAAADHSHSSLKWDNERRALFTQPLPTPRGNTRIGLRLSGLALIIESRDIILDIYELHGRRDSTIGVWLDSALRALGLEPASQVTLPYTIASHAGARNTAYSLSGESEAFDELARWYDAAADILSEVNENLARLYPRVSPVRCWPHHFDIAMLIGLDSLGEEAAKSIGIGLSPGDENYAQPYIYVSPWPHLAPAALPDLPPPGHWHTQRFVAAVATGEEILTFDERGAQLLAFINGAFEIGRARLEA
jgi:hypothetical protein